MRDIRGKKALITGAASGIGRAIALALAGEGADLFLLDVDDAGLADVAQRAREDGVEVVSRHCDLCEPAQISAAVQAILRRWGRLEILVNNAGVAYYGPTHRMTADDWDWLLSINLLAPIQFIRELLPTLMAQSQSHILNVASIAGLVAGNRLAAYHASKFGLVGLSESLRREYGPHAIGVTALCPGFVRTQLFESGRTGRASFPCPPAWLCTTPEIVAARAVRAIRRNQRQVVITPLAHLLFLCKRFVPSLLGFLVGLGRKRPKPAPAQTTERPTFLAGPHFSVHVSSLTAEDARRPPKVRPNRNRRSAA